MEEKPGNMNSPGGFGYNVSFSSDQNLQTHLVGFESSPEIYNLSTSMEMIGFPGKNLHHHHGGGESSGKEMNEPSPSAFYQSHDFRSLSNGALIISSPPWSHHSGGSGRAFLGDDPSLRCVFPCEGNERPSQGLSLSLSSSNPTAIGLQSFELRQDLRFGPEASSRSSQVTVQTHSFSLLRNSQYLGPAQDLLNEFCNLGSQQFETLLKSQKKKRELEDEAAINRQALYSLDLLELQRRKSKLLQMLDEVDRRYRHYCDQMKAVNSSFEAVAGEGAARFYSRMASNAMSRHFRCLRDGIVREIRSLKKAMGEKDGTTTVGTSKGETPRLRLLDQTLRQQRALQQMGMMETHPWRPQRGLPERAVSILRAWLFEHFLHPYPCDVDKHILARQTGLSRSQVSNWFINARVRLWKPMVEEMYREELKETEPNSGGGRRNEDQKPTRDELARMDSESLSSIINTTDKNNQGGNKEAIHQNPTTFLNTSSSYGPQMELDFSSYGHHGCAGGGVSLTLGLHQHDGGGGLGFLPPAANQSSVFERMEECQNQPFSLLETENQTLPYRNLMGAQLLHDLAG